MRDHHVKPLAGGVCAAALAGGSAAELTNDEVGKWAEGHPIFVGTLTGGALLGIAVVIIDALMGLIASQSWHGSLKDTCKAAVRGGRRGADELRRHLGGDAVNQLDPKKENCEEAKQIAREVWVDLGDRVGRASLAAFASEEPELGEAMHQLSTAADTLQRALNRYCSEEPSKTLGRVYEPRHIKERWLDYVWWLVNVDDRGRVLKYSSPVTDKQRDWLRNEIEGDTPSMIRQRD